MAGAKRGKWISVGTAEALMVREKRAKLIEDVAYKLTDLITIISSRLELLSESVPSVHVKDLQENSTDGHEGSRVQRIAVAISTGVPERDGDLKGMQKGFYAS